LLYPASAQTLLEMFNLFNRVSLAPPGTINGGGVAITADSSAIGTARQVSGPGEAFNMQLGLKIIF